MRFLFFVFLLFTVTSRSQTHSAFADSLRTFYHIPELSFAVFSSDHIYEVQALGTKQVNASFPAALTDKFRIGSNTKCITAFIAALLVKEGKISWTTRFFELFPELKKDSDPAHKNLTLLQLLSMRTHLYSYTYTYDKPQQTDFTGDETQQRYQFTAWFLKQPALTDSTAIHFSNLGYVAAGLMLEKASGISFKELVMDLGKKLSIDFGFGQPNSTDSLQPWGHNHTLVPEPPGDNYKLNWLLAAGNVHVSLPDYIKFIQLQLKGLNGRSDLLTSEEFHFIHYSLPQFAIGWFWNTDEKGYKWSTHTGNPGTFLTNVLFCKEKDLGIIVFMNAQTEGSGLAMEELTKELLKNR